MSWIQIRNCRKQYKGVTISYPDITLDTKNILLVGENGSGKSTFLCAIMGWVKVEGLITINGSISMMTEHPMLPRDVTVSTVLQTLCPNLDETLINMYQLTDKLDAPVSSLSKGMKAKLNLLQCIGLDRDIYLFDEPTSGLDQEAILMLINWLKKTKKRWILSTHQPALFSHINCEVIVLDSST